MFLPMPYRESEHPASSSLDFLWSVVREVGKWWTQVSELALAGDPGSQTSSLNPTAFCQIILHEFLISFSTRNISISIILQFHRSWIWFWVVAWLLRCNICDLCGRGFSLWGSRIERNHYFILIFVVVVPGQYWYFGRRLMLTRYVKRQKNSKHPFERLFC